MVIPINSGMIPQQGPSGPTAFCEKMRPYFFAVVALQGLVCLFRLFMMLDIWGGFIMGITVALGAYAYQQEMNITFVSYYGLANLFNGVLDTVRLIDARVHSPLPLFVPQLGFGYNLTGVMVLLIPATGLLAAYVSYQIYKDYTSASSDSLGWSVRAPPRYGAPQGSKYSNAASSSGSRSGPKFEAFSGTGQRLGGDV